MAVLFCVWHVIGAGNAPGVWDFGLGRGGWGRTCTLALRTTLSLMFSRQDETACRAGAKSGVSREGQELHGGNRNDI